MEEVTIELDQTIGPEKEVEDGEMSSSGPRRLPKRSKRGRIPNQRLRDYMGYWLRCKMLSKA